MPCSGHISSEQAQVYNDEDLFAPLVLPGRAARLDELDEALEESLTPARIVGWISDTIWGGDASDEEDEVCA